MAAQLQLARDTHVYASIEDSTGERYYWKLPVLDGFSFSQSNATTEVTLAEMAGAGNSSRRGRKLFTDAFEPAEWNLQMYARPYDSTGPVVSGSTDEVLWSNFVNAGAYTHGSRSFLGGVEKVASATQMDIDFDESNVAALKTFNLFFVLGACGTLASAYNAGPGNDQTIYKVANAVCNSVSMDFDIDGILTLDWSGLGTLITEETAMPAAASGNWYDYIIDDGIAHSEANFIRNRLTTLGVATPGTVAPFGATTSYELTLTGGNISFENNITFLTPEELCVVNQPIGNVTGTRNISGSFTCYLNAGDTVSGAGTSADLFDDLASGTGVVTNSAALTFSIGGGSAPKVVVNVPTAHLEIPTHSIEDVISLEVNFHALPGDLDETNEATLEYHNA